MPTVYIRGVAKNIVEAQPMLVSNNRYCHPVDGVFVTNIILAITYYLPKFLYRSGLVTKGIE
jgi:hypothetical protein